MQSFPLFSTEILNLKSKTLIVDLEVVLNVKVMGVTFVMDDLNGYFNTGIKESVGVQINHVMVVALEIMGW